jgi:hypothetical protein
MCVHHLHLKFVLKKTEEEDDSWKDTFELPPNIDKKTKKRLLNREGVNFSFVDFVLLRSLFSI